MRLGFYPRLALDGIRKNRRMYLPFILTSSIMAAIFYILLFLQQSRTVLTMEGGENVAVMLRFGVIVIAVFSCIFLFYTNSFLIRRRKSEFGIYSILGMNRRNIGRMLLCETFIVYALTVLFGGAAGILLSKLSELLLVNIMSGGITFTLSVSFGSLFYTVIVFGVIFLLLFFNALRQIRFSSTISLIKSEKLGEKPPKGNILFGLLGLVILAAAYWLALSIKDPVAAMVWFLVAVLMVIVATYLIMVSGSILLCRVLQKAKGYYYTPKHFVSVSSMAYRMKRNGAGLASICILATMVLVTVSTTTSMYFGIDDAINMQNPRDIYVRLTDGDRSGIAYDNTAKVRSSIADTADSLSMKTQNVVEYRHMWLRVINTGDTLTNSLDAEGSTVYLSIMPLSDYNTVTKSNNTLKPGEALITTYNTKYGSDTVNLWGSCEYRLKKAEGNFSDYDLKASNTPVITLVVNDLGEIAGPPVQRSASGYSTARYSYLYYFDTGADPQQQLHDGWLFNENIAKRDDIKYKALSYSLRESNKIDYKGNFGGLFYLGIILSIVFLLAAVLIIYYKQISEGYEDRSRFEIMQKVGMTRREIKRSINSQLLTVFYLPLIGAGMHLLFAFPMIRQILQLMQLKNIGLFAITTAVSYLVFTVIYMVVYKITSNAYYNIVKE